MDILGILGLRLKRAPDSSSRKGEMPIVARSARTWIHFCPQLQWKSESRVNDVNEWFSRWMILVWASDVLCYVCLQLPKVKDLGRGKGRGKGRASHPMVALCCTLFKATGCRSLWWKLCGTAFQQGHVMTCLIWCVLKLNWTAGLEIQWVRTKSTKVFGSMLSSWRRWRHLCRALNSLQ